MHVINPGNSKGYTNFFLVDLHDIICDAATDTDYFQDQ